MQPLTVGSGKGGAEWTRGSSRETGDGGFGERTKRAAARILALSHPHTAGTILLRQTTPLQVVAA